MAPGIIRAACRIFLQTVFHAEAKTAPLRCSLHHSPLNFRLLLRRPFSTLTGLTRWTPLSPDFPKASVLIEKRSPIPLRRARCSPRPMWLEDALRAVHSQINFNPCMLELYNSQSLTNFFYTISLCQYILMLRCLTHFNQHPPIFRISLWQIQRHTCV